MRKHRTITIYALGHFCVDFACAFLVLSVLSGTAQWVIGALAYNFCAFALQMPLGLLADHFGSGHRFSALGCLLTAVACGLFDAPIALCILAGLGNALYHIGGGLDTLQLSGKKAGILGVFVSPGAVGLFFGGLLSGIGFLYILIPIALLVVGVAVLCLCRGPENPPLSFSLSKEGVISLLLLFLVVFLRSYAGFLFSFSWRAGTWVILLTAGTASGKALGGFLEDRLGCSKAALCSLLPAAGLFLLSQNPVCGVLAVLLFNMTMPLTLRAAADILPGAKGFSFGLLTFSLFLGFLPAWLNLPGISAGWMYAILTLLSMALLLLSLRHRNTL